jgi:hypothetical protein
VNGLAFSNIKVWNEPTPFLEFDVNEHSVLATLLSDGKDCRYGSHIVSFPTMESSLFGWNHFVGSIRTIPLSQRNALHSSVSISRRRSPAITAEILRRLTAQDELQLQGSLFITWGALGALGCMRSSFVMDGGSPAHMCQQNRPFFSRTMRKRLFDRVLHRTPVFFHTHDPGKITAIENQFTVEAAVTTLQVSLDLPLQVIAVGSAPLQSFTTYACPVAPPSSRAVLRRYL